MPTEIVIFLKIEIRLFKIPLFNDGCEYICASVHMLTGGEKTLDMSTTELHPHP